MSIEKDMSIATTAAIKHFSFPTEKVGYAASDTNFIYKTIDAGSTWDTISFPTNRSCNGIEFFDENSGMCLTGRNLYTTVDGGLTWNEIGNGSFIDITNEGIGVIVLKSTYNCEIMTLSEDMQSLTSVGSVTFHHDLVSFRVNQSKAYLFSKESNHHDEIIEFDLDTKSNNKLQLQGVTYSDDPADIFINDEEEVIVGTSGVVMRRITSYYDRAYHRHNYDYLSVDGYKGFVVAVGAKTICSNLDLQNEYQWNEVFSSDGNGFDQTFYRIRFFNSPSFVISGSNGLLIRARI